MEKQIIVVVLYVVFLVAALVPRIIQKRKQIETVGCIGIDKRIFFLGKITLFSSFILVLVQLFFVNLSLFGNLDVFFWAGVAFIGVGVTFFTLAIRGLGTFSLRVGLAQEKTSLRTTGIYRVSRNPMLLGLFLMAFGSALYVQNPINWVLVFVALAVHHKIILAEEISMRNRFGEEWIAYYNSVRRYV